MNDEPDPVYLKVIEQVGDVFGMSLQVIIVIGEGRLVRKPASNVIRRNAPGFGAERKNQVAVEIGPSGIPMKKENRGIIALPCVQIVH